ncbi:MAG TPA: AAA family ATPase [Verrucomicrobiales bacterium]|jgi:predicted ATP-binding protein involved in virulence|nr:AAA family ATPase [Verrucomicrobiales bacterium]
MRIDHLTVRNFKGFEERLFSFLRAPDTDESGRLREEVDPEKQGSFHLLIGENGSGKSTALDALAVALGVWHVARPTAGWRAIRKEEARLVPRRDGDTVRFEASPSPSISAEGIIGNRAVKWTRMNKGTSGRTTNKEAQEAVDVISGLLEQSRRQDVAVTLPVLACYGAGRAWLPAKARLSNFELKLNRVSRFDAYYYCLEGSIRDQELQQWFLFEAVEAAQRGTKRDGAMAVEEAVLRCVPGATSLRFDADRKEIVIGLTGGEMPFYSLSDGQRTLFSLVADIAIKAAVLNPHLGRDSARRSPGVVLIDELDLHLHPKWQRRVVENLRQAFPNLQFICTTHSPFVVQTLREGELIPMDAQPVPETGNLTIEEIARGLMGVKRTDVSPRYEEMKQAARDYLTTLEEAARAPADKLAEYERRLSEGIGPYADNPAFQAFLELKREAKLGGTNGTRGNTGTIA